MVSPNHRPSADPPVGIGLRRPHIADVLTRQPVIGFFETHPENYMLDRAELAKLEKVRARYPLSLHAVGLSLGSAEGIDDLHLNELARLADRLEPMMISDHLSWSVAGGAYLNDLLPIPYTKEALDVMSRNILRAQERLKRRILIENPSLYAQFERADFGETEFMRALIERTGCGLLLDVNNVYVSAWNLGFEAKAYIDDIPAGAVEEIHLAGHARKELGSETVLIDDHGSRVSEAVWELYAFARARSANAATLIEWDSNIPSLDILLAEARRAAAVGKPQAQQAAQLSLAETQRRMAQVVIGNEDASASLGLRGHISVYRNNVQHSLREALSAAYPAVVSLVGEDFFGQLAAHFLRAHPPAMPCVAGYGEALPVFIEAAPQLQDLPYLADVARLDWLASRVSLFEPMAVLTADELSAAARDTGPEDLTFEFQPGLAYLASQYPVAKIWDFARSGDSSAAAPELTEGQSFVEISCDGETVKLRTLDEAAFVFREALHSGLGLGRAATAARMIDPMFALSEALRLALRDGIFTRCQSKQTEIEEAMPCCKSPSLAS